MTIRSFQRPQCKRKLNADQVREIRAARDRMVTYAALADRFGVHCSSIKRVCDFSTYKEVR
jgi:hypothetical protein